MRKLILALAIALFFASSVSAAAEFDVTMFTCNGGTNTDVVIGQSFDCSATVKNNGNSDGSLGTATLSAGSGDAAGWLQQESYSGSGTGQINQGSSITVTFSNIVAKKTGNNGFSILLGNENDAGVANTKVNVINVNVLTSNSASSAAMGETFTVTPEVTVGGNVDATLTLTVDSGGCSIGNQQSSRSQTVTNGALWNGGGSWTVTQGTSGDCRFTLTATATGANGAATKSATSSSTVTCSNCPTDSGSSSSSSGGGGGGAGGGKIIATLGELSESKSYELRGGESVAFTFGNENHSISVFNLTETTARIVIKSKEQSFTLSIGEEKQVDFEEDGKAEVIVRLKSINIVTKKALFILTPLYIPATGAASGNKSQNASEARGAEEGKPTTVIPGSRKTPRGWSSASTIVVVIVIILIIGIVIAAIRYARTQTHQQHLRRSILVRRP